MLTDDFIRHVLAHPLQYSDGCAALAREVLRLRALSEPVWGEEQSEAIQSIESALVAAPTPEPARPEPEKVLAYPPHASSVVEAKPRKLGAHEQPEPARFSAENDGIGLSIDMLDADRIRQYAQNLLTYGPDITHWASVPHVVSRLQILATNIEQAVRDIGKLRALAAPPQGTDPSQE